MTRVTAGAPLSGETSTPPLFKVPELSTDRAAEPTALPQARVLSLPKPVSLPSWSGSSLSLLELAVGDGADDAQEMRRSELRRLGPTRIESGSVETEPKSWLSFVFPCKTSACVCSLDLLEALPAPGSSSLNLVSSAGSWTYLVIINSKEKQSCNN